MIRRCSTLLALCGTFLVATAACAQQRGKSGNEKEYNAPPDLRERHPDKLKAGDLAPDFTLPDLAKKEVKLSSFQGKRPVMLIFGSCT